MREGVEGLAALADANVAAISDAPDGRLALAASFYADHGGPELSYERAPLAFIRWEVRRGVLDPVSDGGSPWWRAVNGRFLRDAEEARLIIESGADGPGSNAAVDRWLAFAREPTRCTWYAAHNSSVAMGYIDHAVLARDEAPLEQLLINHTITRVLFAEELEDGSRLDLGLAAAIARWLSDPRTDGVDVFVHVPSFYPDHYPLSQEDRRRLTHRDHSIEGVLTSAMDDIVVGPVVPHLFSTAAVRLALADLARFVHVGAVAYPWTLLLTPEELAHHTIEVHKPSLIWRALAHVLHPGGADA